MRLGHSVLLAGCAFTASLSGCFPPDEGRNPPLDRLYFPVGVALDTTGDRLYVANSDFDLQFNAGTVQVYNLESLRAFLPNFEDPEEERPCKGLGEKSDAERLLAPGRCGALDPMAPPSGPDILLDVVEIGAFATDVIYRADPNANAAGDAGATPVSQPGRLFIPVRGDATMHWIDVNRGGNELDCGQGGRTFGGTCDDNHRRGDDPVEENTRDYFLPSEPYGIAADDNGEVVVVTHQTDGQLALFVNDWASGAAGGPDLRFVLGGLPSGAVAVASVPEPKIVALFDLLAAADPNVQPIPHQPSFLVAFRNSTEIRLVRFFPDTGGDDGAEPPRPFIEASRATNITALSQGFESRGLAIDAAERQNCERQCAEGDEGCLRDCAGIPLGVYASNRRPSSLLLGETRPDNSETSSDDLPRFFDAVPVSPGAGRVVVGDVLGRVEPGAPRDGNPVRRVFIVCFDARKLYIYDPVGARVEKVVQTGRGPHALAIDGRNGLGYLAHFTDSYIGVIDLDQNKDTYGEIVLTLGHPSPPRASK
jgi:hypothetical protein